MDSCYVCNIKFSGRGDKTDKIQCTACLETAHLKCLNIRKEDLDFLKTESSFKCQGCTRRKSDVHLIEPSAIIEKSNSGLITMLQEIKSEIIGIKETQRTLEVELGKSIEFCHEKLDACLKNQENYAKKLEETLNRLEEVKRDNLMLQKENKELKIRIEDLEQYSRINMLEIHGIPVQPQDNPAELIKKVGNALDVNLQDCDIDACHRINTHPTSQLPSPIVVKFCRRSTKEELLHRRRVKRNLNTLDIGFTLSSQIYINESLCPARRRLLAKCRQLRRSADIKFLWTRNGKIFMRKEDTSLVHNITTEEDLEKFGNSL